MFLVWSAVKKQTLRETLIDIIDANTHALALRFTLEDLLEVTGIWIGLERPDHKYVNNFGLAWQASINLSIISRILVLIFLQISSFDFLGLSDIELSIAGLNCTSPSPPQADALLEEVPVLSKEVFTSNVQVWEKLYV